MLFLNFKLSTCFIMLKMINLHYTLDKVYFGKMQKELFVCVLLFELTVVTLVSAVASDGGGGQNSDDYFYDQGLSQSEINEKRLEKAELEREREAAAAKAKPVEDAPEWFAASNDTSDPMKEFMEGAIKDYMKKMQKEYMEKMKMKKKSDINHSFWSIITLVVFFGTGIVIGLSLVMIRGSKLSKSTRRRNAKSTSNNNHNNSSVRSKTAYTSVPQGEQQPQQQQASI